MICGIVSLKGKVNGIRTEEEMNITGARDSYKADLPGRRENRVIIAGSRDFTDYDKAEKALFEAFRSIDIIGPVRIVSGHCRGSDLLGEEFAARFSLMLSVFPAKWKMYGKSAGFVRNNEMARFACSDDCQADLIAFWDGKSRGTKMMIDIARKKGIRVHAFDLNGKAYS